MDGGGGYGEETLLAERALAEMVERIVTKFEPARVVLFGSRSRGEQTYDSDVDLLVVFDRVPREEKRRLTVEIRRALADVPFPKDVVVADPEEISRRGKIPGTVLHEALREGKTLYERG